MARSSAPSAAVLATRLDAVDESLRSAHLKLDQVATRGQVEALQGQLRNLEEQVQRHDPHVAEVPALAARVRVLEDDRTRAWAVISLLSLLGGGGIVAGIRLFLQ